MKTKTVLIIGGNGFIGTNLGLWLLKNGYNVQSFDMRGPAQVTPGIRYIEGDFFDDYTLAHVVEGVDCVVHALSTVNPGNSNSKYEQGYARDLLQSVRLCEMLIPTHTRMIFLSSGGTVYGVQNQQPIQEDALPRPINHYGNIKLCIENTLRTFNVQAGTDFRIARISNPYGPGQDFHKGVGFIDASLKQMLRGEPLEIWGDGENVRDYIYIEDVCAMLGALVEYEGSNDVFNISSGCGASQNQIVELIQGLGIRGRVIYKPARSVDVRCVTLDNTRIKNIYKKDMRSLREGIALYYHWLSKHSAVEAATI